jgi:hypothetical protein
MRSFVIWVGMSAATSPSLAAQADTWNLQPATVAPPARSAAGCTYDSVRQRVVLFGGRSGNQSDLADTWEWDGTNWLARLSLQFPPARSLGALAYDAARQRVVLFGGAASGSLQDTWEWDGSNWQQRTPAVRPSARHSHAMVYDAARQRVVLFGGNVGGIWNNQTWEWDGTTWSQRQPQASPQPRIEHAMAYDPVRQRVLLHGGVIDQQNPSTMPDTWEWDGTNWMSRAAPAPARRGHAMAYDSSRQRVVLFGGSSAETWEFDGTAWSLRTPSVSPSARSFPALAYDAARQRTVLFSGLTFPLVNDTWTRGTAGTPATALAYGIGCGAPALGMLPSANGRPVLGQTGAATLTNLTSPLAAVAMGISNTVYGPFSLPAPLAGSGMPGCELLQSSEVLGFAVTPLSASTGSFQVSIPNQLSLIGQRVYVQG